MSLNECLANCFLSLVLNRYVKSQEVFFVVVFFWGGRGLEVEICQSAPCGNPRVQGILSHKHFMPVGASLQHSNLLC